MVNHKRIHIRIPVIAHGTLSTTEGTVIQVQTIDISEGGFRVDCPSTSFGDTEFDVNISTNSRGNINFKAIGIHANGDVAGFKITDIDSCNLHTICLLIYDFQSTEEFIKYIDEKNILHEWLSDDNGDMLDVTFEAYSI
ncbi:PilZ domain-containing protein [Desulfopila aestuarii]|uniref:PilZ domain-containing protein n=1 Tax=Desulfopila aestuarii DSM 18488 TaxID=1121416 RepID=A0A1M7Y112_9BACT|nr:PilZ domain-containing protein [Desulfopila aestuarii]SHO45321.1 PilZ domain-containing protein [Desulfopila aestuarii DSM 18488]